MKSGVQRRAERALQRQLDYQSDKAKRVIGHEAATMAHMAARSVAVEAKLRAVQPFPATGRVIEVGSGAHGLIFYFDAAERIGVDPLANEYRRLFPAWQGRAKTIAAFGEQLPFPNADFDIVLCDNVVDHAESPRRIVEEIARVLKPGGLLYFTVNIHHPIYRWAATVHAAWQALRLPFEITPFADHTVHLTLGDARRLFDGLPLTRIRESNNIEATKQQQPRIRHTGDRLKRLFFKNAQYELIAVRD